MAEENKALAPMDSLKKTLATESVQQQFKNALVDSAPLFVASLIDLFGSDNYLQQCLPHEVVREALKAATLRLPINKNLGFAWIIPRYNNNLKRYVPVFQIGYKGIIQLAQRTGQYRFINCGPVCEGELRRTSKLTGELDIDGVATSGKIVGYFAYIETVSGFSKPSYWTKEKVEAHAIKFNPECKKVGKLAGNWLEYFEERAMTTVLKHLISKYGPMSIEMSNYLPKDTDDDDGEHRARRESDQNANKIPLDLEPEGNVVEGEFTDKGNGVADSNGGMNVSPHVAAGVGQQGQQQAMSAGPEY